MPLYWLRTRGDVLIEAPNARAALKKADRLGIASARGGTLIPLPDATPGPRNVFLTAQEARQAGIYGRPDV